MALLTVAGALLWATGIRAQVAITDIAVRSNVVTLDWAASTDLCLVAVSTSLCSGLFTYVGDVLATNGARLTDAGDCGFYRVCRVAAIDFPDTNLEAVIRAAMPVVHAPLDYLYDVDLAVVTNLDAQSTGVGDTSGLESLTGLEQLDLSGNELYGLDLSFSVLRYLACDDCGLGDLPLDGFPRLQVLSCNGNSLPDLDLSPCGALADVSCRSNRLQTIDFSGCAGLRNLDCSCNLLDDLDLSPCTSLDTLCCEFNHLTNLDLSACASLGTLHCGLNYLANLDLSACTNLTSIECDDNTNLASVELGPCLCANLSCARGALTDLDVHECPALVALDCSGNAISSLNLASCGNMQVLHCETNTLTTLDLSDCVNLQELHADRNSIILYSVFWPDSVSQLTLISLRGNPVGSLEPLIELAAEEGLEGCQLILSEPVDQGQVDTLTGYGVSVTVYPN